MWSRALILAAVAFALGCYGARPAGAQNLEAGKAPSQIFSSTCSLCHKSPRGLLKTVSPGSLPSFLRQHYTTSTDMAAAMSAYVLSNGAANVAAGGNNLTRQGQEAKGGPASDSGGRGRRPSPQEAAKPDADGTPESAAHAARQKAAAERRAARQAARSKAGEELPPKNEARHEASKGAAGNDDSTKVESPKDDLPKSETRPDPVPAVTPAPPAAEKEAETAAVNAAPKPVVVEDPNRPLTIDMGPAPVPAAGSAVTASGPPPVPAGKPEPPISR